MEVRPRLAAAALLASLLPSCGNEVIQLTTSSSSSTTATGAMSSAATTSSSGTGGQPPCTTSQECPSPPAPCQVAVCDQGRCGVVAAPINTPCVGAGGGKFCADGAKAGQCVECNEAFAGSQCTSNVCVDNTCVEFTCSDGLKNASETDVDCGGPDCVGCANGADCVVFSDCASGNCTATGCESPCSPPGILPSAIPGCHNITTVASASASDALDPAAWAIDQDICSSWNAGHTAPADLTLFLGSPRAVRGITLVPDMAPDGGVTHIVETSMDGMNFTTALTINQFMAKNVAYPFDLGAPVMAQYIRVRTSASPAWVAWFEIALFECP